MNNQFEDQIFFCNLCSKQAHFICSNCEEVAYCKIQHQRADWINHKSKCISPSERQVIHEKQRISFRNKIFQKLSRRQFLDCEALSNQLMIRQQKHLDSFPTKQNQLQYSATLLFHVRLMIITKDYNKAQDILNKYVTEKNQFIENISDIPSKMDQKNPNFQQQKRFALGKIRLVSTLANLTHQLVRNSIQIVQILIKHIQKFYGPQSIQLSNCYFQTGMYYNFMNQANKSAACFLKAGKLRKQQGAGCYYNAALIMGGGGQDYKALDFFQLALKTFDLNQKINQNNSNINLKISILQNLGIFSCKMDDFQSAIKYFQGAVCLLQSGFKQDGVYRVKNIKNILKAIKKVYSQDIQETKNYKLELPHQKLEIKKYAYISNNDFQLFWNAEENHQQQQKEVAWKQSFKQFRKKLRFDNIGIKPPQVVQKYLQVERDHHYQNQQTRNVKAYDNSAKDSNPKQQIKVNLDFMRQLSSIQVDYLNQLNNFLAESKDKTTLYDFVQGSNFLKSLNIAQVNTFYKLNPALQKPKKVSIGSKMNEQQLPIDQRTEKQKIKTPRLNLSQLNRG